MSRLIDADALKEYILRSVPNWSEDREIVLDCIANSPTIEERKKGEWINWDEYPCWDRCSVCGHPVNTYANEDDYYFCPNCGADMREENDKIERNCNSCIWSTRDGRCSSWDCEFVDKREAYKAWKEKLENEQA